ncbi:MAG: hypothetical protein ACRDKG_17140 [Actinomycetota bacterium]
MSRRPIRWRIAETFEGRNGAKVILAIGVLVFAAIVVPLAFRPFEGRGADPEINQSAIDCHPPVAEVTRTIPEGTTANNPVRVCIERARGRVAIACVATFFIIFFTIIALLARAGKIQPREPAR